MRVAHRRGRLLTASVTASVLLIAGCTGDGGAPTPEEPTGPEVGAGAVIDQFAQAWSESDRPDFRSIVDEPSVAANDIAAHVAELGILDTSVQPLGDIDCGDDSCREYVEVVHELTGVGEWRYESLVQAELDQGQWLVRWTAGTFHPDLAEGTTLVTSRKLPPRAPILGRSGKALTPERAIVRIGVVPGKAKRESYTRLGALLDLDSASLEERARASEPNWFVPVIDLRRSDYVPLRRDLLRVPGVSVDTAQRALPPTSEWGRAVLGTVGPATKEALDNAGSEALPADEVGLSGLQYTYQKQLAGTAGISINLVEKASPTDVLNKVFTRRAEPGQPLETTLDIDAQSAAERAVSEATDTTAAVVVKASTGEVLAAANAPGPTSFNTAFVGRYAPGSTFKVVSAAALLATGEVTRQSSIQCPDTTVVEGKRFKNYDVGLLPARADFTDAFAASCNTTFVSLADDISGDDLAGMADKFGLGAEWDLGVDAFSGSVPADADLVTRAADMIGQGKVLASPLAMAMTAATVDSGVSRTPTLLPGQQPGVRLEELDPALVTSLQSMMRQVVTRGTGSSIDLPGLPVHAKTGTAEVAVDGRIATNAWMIGYRGDVAFAVLVEDGSSGADDAAPIVSSLLTALPNRLYQ